MTNETSLESDGFESDVYASNVDKCVCTIKAARTSYMRASIKFMTLPDSDRNRDDCASTPLLRIAYRQVRSTRLIW